MTQPLISSYDAALFDLDGVIYLGPQVIPGAAESVAQLREKGVRVGFVTNNAARAPRTVGEHLTELGIHADIEDIVTSAQAIAHLMADELPEGAPVLVCGTDALKAEITAKGLAVVNSAADAPVAVVQGYDPQMTLPRLEDACQAIQAGARWYVSNTDSTRPTDKGLVPGAGALMEVVRVAVEATPIIAGKPHAPLMRETVDRLQSRQPLFVGDRIDTDIMGAVGVGMDSLLVFTGAHGKRDLLEAGPEGRPTHIGHDLASLHAPARALEVDGEALRCGQARAHVEGGEIALDAVPADREAQYDALWAVVNLAWRSGADGHHAIARLDQLS